jgi:hypothetical protein
MPMYMTESTRIISIEFPIMSIVMLIRMSSRESAKITSAVWVISPVPASSSASPLMVVSIRTVEMPC